MITRFYYNIKELCNEEVLAGFRKLLSNWDVAFTDTQYTTELFNHIEETYYYDYILYVDVEHPLWEIPTKPTVAQIKATERYLDQVFPMIKKIKGWIDDSQFRYEKLLQLFAAQENNLMKQVETISTSQFNDTPQTTTSGLDGDQFATTYTKNRSATDLGTVMSRLNEIRDSWNSLYGEWERSFARNFIIYND